MGKERFTLNYRILCVNSNVRYAAKASSSFSYEVYSESINMVPAQFEKSPVVEV